MFSIESIRNSRGVFRSSEELNRGTCYKDTCQTLRAKVFLVVAVFIFIALKYHHKSCIHLSTTL